VSAGPRNQPENGHQAEAATGQYQPTHRNPPGPTLAGGFARIWYGVFHSGLTPMIAATATTTPHPLSGILTIRVRLKTDSEDTFLQLIQIATRDFFIKIFKRLLMPGLSIIGGYLRR
jgi:hypothetical protein